MFTLDRSHALRSLALLVGCIAPSALACSSNEAGGTPDATPNDAASDPSGFIDAFTDLYCDSIGPCCRAAGYGHDAAACKASLDLRAIPAAIELGVPFSEDAAAQCLQELAMWFDACPMTWPPSCNRVLVGSRPPGGGCFTAYQCAPPDKGLTLCVGGECNTVRYLAAGAACSGNVIEWTSGVFVQEMCEPPLYCDVESKCRLPPAPGDPCDSKYIYGCRIDAYCAATSPSICEPRVAMGASCVSAKCTLDAYCDGSICLPLKSADAACSADGECFSKSCVNDACLGGTALLVPFESLQCIQ